VIISFYLQPSGIAPSSFGSIQDLPGSGVDAPRSSSCAGLRAVEAASGFSVQELPLAPSTRISIPCFNLTRICLTLHITSLHLCRFLV
jgi:hypothetical protein